MPLSLCTPKAVHTDKPKSYTAPCLFVGQWKLSIPIHVHLRAGRSKHSGKVSKPVPEKPAACPAAVEAVPDAHNSDLVYGLAHGDQDTLLPGFVSRPHPSPTNRLVQAKQTASPVIASALQPQSTSRCQSKQLRSSKRRLVFHQEAKHDEATQAEPVGGTAPCSSPTAADAERWPDAYEETNDEPEAPKQSATDQQSRVASPVQPTFMAAETPRHASEGHVTEAQQKKPKRGECGDCVPVVI